MPAAGSLDLWGGHSPAGEPCGRSTVDVSSSVIVTHGVAGSISFFFSTALAFVIYFRLVQTLGSVGTTCAIFGFHRGGYRRLVSWETLAPTAWIGLGCVVAGVIAMTLPSRKDSQGAQSRP